MKKIAFLRTALGVVCVLLLAGTIATASYTLIDVWIPITGAAVAALASGAPLWKHWRRLTNSEKFIFNYLCHAVCTAIVLVATYYIGNYALADRCNTHSARVTVEKKYHKTRHHSRRVSRNHYAQGAPYKVYYATIKFDNGRTKDLSISLKQYCRFHQGDTISLPIARGGFGIPVIAATPPPQPKSSRSIGR